MILTAPAVAALRGAAPRAEIVMVCDSSSAPLARMMPGLDRVIEYRNGRLNMRAWASMIAGPWDACLDFTGTDRAALLMRMSRAKRRIAYAKFATNLLRRRAPTELCEASVRELHTVDFHLALVSAFAGSSVKEQGAVQMTVPMESEERIRSLLGDAGIRGEFAVVHPGTAREEKFWPDDRWSEVIDRLVRDFKLPVVLTGSGDGLEKPHLARIRRTIHEDVVDLSGRLSLDELAAVIDGASLVLGVDSMAMHLASMFRRPQIALFGPTNPHHWRPRHDRAIVLGAGADGRVIVTEPKAKKAEMKNVSTQTVVDAIGSALRTNVRTSGEE